MFIKSRTIILIRINLIFRYQEFVFILNKHYVDILIISNQNNADLTKLKKFALRRVI